MKLMNAENRRDAIKASIAKSEKILEENQMKIDEAREKIAALEV